METCWGVRIGEIIPVPAPLPCLGISHIDPETSQSVVLGSFMCFPHRLRDMGMSMIRLGLLILNEYRCRITNILTNSVYNSRRCIIGRQSVWWKKRLWT